MQYPPPHDECVKLFDELKQLDASSDYGFNPRKYEIIHDLAEAQFYESKSYFIRGLDNPDPDYRYAVISALITHWSQSDPAIVAKLVELAQNDMDVQVRMIAVDSLGILKISSAKELLGSFVRNQDEDPDVRRLAEKALREIT